MAYRGLNVEPLRPFTQSDWYVFNGAEKIDGVDEPLIYEGDWFTVVVSGAGKGTVMLNVLVDSDQFTEGEIPEDLDSEYGGINSSEIQTHRGIVLAKKLCKSENLSALINRINSSGVFPKAIQSTEKYEGLEVTPLREFDRNAWMAYSGAEKINGRDNPLIYSHPLLGDIILHDTSRIEILPDEFEFMYSKDLPDFKSALSEVKETLDEVSGVDDIDEIIEILDSRGYESQGG